MKTKIIYSSVILLLLTGGALFIQHRSKISNYKSSLLATDVAKSEILNKNEEAIISQGAGAYSDYSEEAVKKAQQEGKKVVLFFHATWCPECKTADADFRSHPERIPSDVVVFKTDYDSQKDLKQKYGVIYQHTFVQIDSDGKAIAKWTSGDTLLLAKNLK